MDFSVYLVRCSKLMVTLAPAPKVGGAGWGFDKPCGRWYIVLASVTLSREAPAARKCGGGFFFTRGSGMCAASHASGHRASGASKQPQRPQRAATAGSRDG